MSTLLSGISAIPTKQSSLYIMFSSTSSFLSIVFTAFEIIALQIRYQLFLINLTSNVTFHMRFILIPRLHLSFVLVSFGGLCVYFVEFFKTFFPIKRSAIVDNCLFD